MFNLRHFLTTFSLLAFFVFASLFSVSAQKMKAEEIVAKHLEALGSQEARKKLKNQVASGIVQYRVLRKNTGGDGRIVLASEGSKILFGMTFSIPSYPAETFIFDGKKSKIAFAINNARSEFGDFVYRYQDVLSEGLFGGTLSSAWTLADLSSRKAKVDLDGTKKINDREAYQLTYLPKGGSDLQIAIFIDKETFQHVRTEYRRIISSQQGASPDSSAQQREQRQVLIEDFSNYKKENDLSLPHEYRAYIMLEGGAGTREYEYKAEFSQFYFNQPLDAASFKIESE